MWNRQYNVTMQTSMGARYGTMTVTVDGSRVNGILTILKKAVPFDGMIREDGNCRITGSLITLMRTIPYDATGQMTQTSLQLTLRGAQETFELSGHAVDSFSSSEKES